MSNLSQNQSILAVLKEGESLTPMDGLQRFNCFRLGARISDLRNGKVGGVKYPIETLREKKDGKRYARYVLIMPAIKAIMDTPAFPPKVETNAAQLL
jgi:hypothetical protein